MDWAKNGARLEHPSPPQSGLNAQNSQGFTAACNALLPSKLGSLWEPSLLGSVRVMIQHSGVIYEGPGPVEVVGSPAPF